MKKILIRLVLSITFCLYSASIAVGSYGGVVLALSGGGTRGFAHVGVLKVLEEENIPIAGIVGTSMGSIIGGIAACGYSAGELEGIIMDLNLKTLLYDRSQPFFYPIGREDYTNLAVFRRIYLNDKRQVVGPLGGLTGDKLLNKLNEITSPCRNIKDFDKLPIPFAAVATDLYEGQPVVIRKGSIAEAMRASMSIPGLFQPWEMQGHLLVDGGLVANVPVKIAKEVFPGYPVIAVNISSSGKKPGQIRSIVDVLDQSINIMTTRDLKANLDAADLVIRPEVGSLPMLSTSGFSSIIAAGEKQAERQLKDIKALAEKAPAIERADTTVVQAPASNGWTEEEIRDYDKHEDVKYQALFGAYYSSFHNRNYLFSDFQTVDFLQKGDILMSQAILGREWGLKFAYEDPGVTWNDRSECSLSVRHREIDPTNGPSDSWERYAVTYTGRTKLGRFRAGIGVMAEKFDSENDDSDSYAGPTGHLLYNTLDDFLDPTEGFYFRTDLYWRDLDRLVGRMEYKALIPVEKEKSRILMEGGLFAGDEGHSYSMAYLGAREELHYLADHPLAGENAAWWRATFRKVLTESWWGTVNADIFFTQGYLLDDDFRSTQEPWETGVGFSIPGSLLNATVFAVYTDKDDWHFGATIGIPIRNNPFGP